MQELTNSYTEKVKRIHDKYQEQLDSVGSKNDGIIAKIAQRFEEDFATISAKYQTQLEKLQSSGETNYNSIVEKFNSDYENFVQKQQFLPPITKYWQFSACATHVTLSVKGWFGLSIIVQKPASGVDVAVGFESLIGQYSVEHSPRSAIDRIAVSRPLGCGRCLV